jgi:preprotein translocase subunit YajC
MNDLLLMLAQASQPTGPVGPPPSGTEVLVKNFLPMFVIIGVFWWWMSRSRRRERQRFEDMLKNLKRNDRVQTIGGIIGTVVDAREDEVVLKVDETNNVKIRFARSAIKDVLRESAPSSSQP